MTFLHKKVGFFITNCISLYIKGDSVYSTQCLKNEPFRRYSELKISMLCIYVMYELAQLNKITEQSESELAGYL